MKQTLFVIYDKVAEDNSGIMVGKNRMTVARDFKQRYTEDVINKKMDPRDYKIIWVGQMDTDTLKYERYTENNETEFADIFKIDVTEQDISREGVK